MLNPRLIRKKRKWIKNYTHIYIYTNEFEPRERSISLSAALNYSLARGWADDVYAKKGFPAVYSLCVHERESSPNKTYSSPSNRFCFSFTLAIILLQHLKGRWIAVW